MQIQQPAAKKELENLLPLVNVVFLLLIFFMLAGAFTSPEFFSITPTIAKNETQADPQILTILMNQKGELAIEQNRISDATLKTRINNYLDEYPKQKVQLKPDARAEAVRLVEVLELLGTTKLDAVHIVTTESQ